jgi:hypothetical protein
MSSSPSRSPSVSCSWGGQVAGHGCPEEPQPIDRRQEISRHHDRQPSIDLVPGAAHRSPLPVTTRRERVFAHRVGQLDRGLCDAGSPQYGSRSTSQMMAPKGTGRQSAAKPGTPGDSAAFDRKRRGGDGHTSPARTPRARAASGVSVLGSAAGIYASLWARQSGGFLATEDVEPAKSPRRRWLSVRVAAAPSHWPSRPRDRAGSKGGSLGPCPASAVRCHGTPTHVYGY